MLAIFPPCPIPSGISVHTSTSLATIQHLASLTNKHMNEDWTLKLSCAKHWLWMSGWAPLGYSCLVLLSYAEWTAKGQGRAEMNSEFLCLNVVCYSCVAPMFSLEWNKEVLGLLTDWRTKLEERGKIWNKTLLLTFKQLSITFFTDRSCVFTFCVSWLFTGPPVLTCACFRVFTTWLPCWKRRSHTKVGQWLPLIWGTP